MKIRKRFSSKWNNRAKAPREGEAGRLPGATAMEAERMGWHRRRQAWVRIRQEVTVWVGSETVFRSIMSNRRLPN